MVVGQDEPVVVGCGAGQCGPKWGGVVEVSDRAALVDTPLLEGLFGVGGGGEVEVCPVQVGVGGDELYGLVEVVVDELCC